jgi:protein-disulfide isomerase
MSTIWPVGSAGLDNAPVTIIVFSDFASFPCSRSASVLSELLEASGQIQVIFKHAPAVSNSNGLLAHEAAIAAGAQGQFGEETGRNGSA